MADEYITKEQAKVAFDDSLRLSTKEWNMIFEGIDALPAADVAPVTHGRWGAGAYAGYRCSACKTTWDAPTAYCPNCGAKMDGEAVV